MSNSKYPDLRKGVEQWRIGDIAECIARRMRCSVSGVAAPKLGERFIVSEVYDGPVQAATTNRKWVMIALQFEGHPHLVFWHAAHFRKVGLEQEIKQAAARAGLRAALKRVTRRNSREKVDA